MIYRVHSGLAVLARPRGGDWLEADLRILRASGFDVLVSLLTREEIVELDLGEEADASGRLGLEYLSFPIDDRGVPRRVPEARQFIDSLVERIRAGRKVGIHCRAGIGRSPMIAIAVLMLLGQDLDAAVADVARARGFPVPEAPEQLVWLRSLTT